MRGLDLLFLSGWAHGPEALSPIAEALQGRHGVVLTSLHGLFDESSHANDPPAGVDREGTSPYARAVIHRLRRAERPVCLVGWSTGGMVAIEAATAAPEAVCALVLLGTTACFCSKEGHPFGPSPAALRAMRRALSRDPRAVLTDFFSQASSPGHISGEDLSSKVDRALSHGIDPLIHGLDYLQNTDLRAILPCVRQPSLILHGREDKVIPWSASEFLSRHIAHSSAGFLPDVGHTLIEQRTEEIVRRMQTLLESLP